MSTLNLAAAIDKACEDLRWITEAIAKIGAKGTLSKDSNDFFKLSSRFETQLQQAKQLIPLRDAALEAVKKFPSLVSPTDPSLFLYNGRPVTFKDGRFLLLQNYSVTSWAIYDSLSKVAGTLSCCDEIIKNRTSPVKLYEHFLNGKNGAGARVRDHLIGGYAWPITLSYKIRNWLAHDGHCNEGVEMFKYDTPVASSEFEINDAAWTAIEKKCDPYTVARTRRSAFPDVKRDVVNGLEICHEEVDEAMAFVLLWSTGVVKLQGVILFPRDS